jgi:hypothetical protein
VGEPDVAALLGHDGKHCRHVSPGRVTGDGDTGRVESAARALPDYPLSDRVGLLILRRVLCLGRS